MSDLAVTPEVFAQHVEFYRRHYECVNLRDAMARLADGSTPTRPLLSITFDDGYVDNYDNARPILNKSRISATFFVITSLVETDEAPWYDRLARAAAYLARSGSSPMHGESWPDMDQYPVRQGNPHDRVTTLVRDAKQCAPDVRLALVDRFERCAVEAGMKREACDRLMSVDQLKTLASEGHEVASHTQTHPMLTQMDSAVVRAELEDSRAELEKMVGQGVTSFSYPNGDYDDAIVEAVRRAGYDGAVTMNPGVNRGPIDPFRLERVYATQDRFAPVGGGFSANILSLELSGLADTIFFRRYHG